LGRKEGKRGREDVREQGVVRGQLGVCGGLCPGQRHLEDSMHGADGLHDSGMGVRVLRRLLGLWTLVSPLSANHELNDVSFNEVRVTKSRGHEKAVAARQPPLSSCRTEESLTRSFRPQTSS